MYTLIRYRKVKLIGVYLTIFLLLPIIFISCNRDEAIEGLNPDVYGGDGSAFKPQYSRRLFTRFKNFPDEHFIQSVAIYKNFWFGVGFQYLDGNTYHPNNAFIIICDLNKSEYITKLYIDHKNLAVPHGNVSCFGNETLDGTEFPPLYVSQWNHDGARGVIVLRIDYNNGNFSCETIQTIVPKIFNQEVFGYGCTDWVVDTDQSLLYSLAYYRAGSSTLVEGNKECVCVFDLPKIIDGEEILLNDDNIKDSFNLEMINYSQDKCYYKDHILVSSGESSYPYWLKIRSIGLFSKKVEYELNLSRWGLEPEGLDIYMDNILMNYGGSSQYMLQLL